MNQRTAILITSEGTAREKIFKIKDNIDNIWQVFPIYCWNRDYLLYPNYNYLSWSYAAALASILSFLASFGSFTQVNSGLLCGFSFSSLLISGTDGSEAQRREELGHPI